MAPSATSANAQVFSTYALRVATPADEEFLYRLYATTREDEMNAAGFAPEQREAFLQMQFRAQNTHYEKFYLLSIHQIITLHEQPVGREWISRTADEILVLDLVLLPEFCGQGIGSARLREIFAEGDETGQPVRLHVLKENIRAWRFYERLGFRPIEDDGLHYLLERAPAQN